MLLQSAEISVQFSGVELPESWNSIPTKGIMYGMPVRGMKPKKPKARAEVLEPDVTYRLHIRGRNGAVGQVDFVTREAAQSATR